LETAVALTIDARKPVLAAHWDADLYPRDSRPITQELVLHILRHGNVLIKDVDLLLNPAIRTELSEKGIRTQFRSLLETGRIKVLLPPLKSTKFDLDPTRYPLTAMARERHNKRPHKFRIWQFREPYQRFCAILDPIIANTNAIKFRADYPLGNDFAATLYRVLTEQSWRARREFKGIDRMVDRYAEYCLNPEDALKDLRDQNVTPLATEFYRTIAYQCVRLRRFRSTREQERNMRRLLQSVYAYCETSRESAVSTYYAERLTELPAVSQDNDTLDVGMLQLIVPDIKVKIPVAENIGEILEKIIHDCPNIADIWAMSDPSSDDLPSLESLTEACAAISESFAEHAMTAKKVQWSPRAEERWNYFEIAHRIIFLIGLLGTHGIAFVKDFEGPITIAEAVAIFAKPVVYGIRTGKAWDDLDTERAAVMKLIFTSLRSGPL